jgi:hypothetical protein
MPPLSPRPGTKDHVPWHPSPRSIRPHAWWLFIPAAHKPTGPLDNHGHPPSPTLVRLDSFPCPAPPSSPPEPSAGLLWRASATTLPMKASLPGFNLSPRGLMTDSCCYPKGERHLKVTMGSRRLQSKTTLLLHMPCQVVRLAVYYLAAFYSRRMPPSLQQNGRITG